MIYGVKSVFQCVLITSKVIIYGVKSVFLIEYRLYHGANGSAPWPVHW